MPFRSPFFWTKIGALRASPPSASTSRRTRRIPPLSAPSSWPGFPDSPTFTSSERNPAQWSLSSLRNSGTRSRRSPRFSPSSSRASTSAAFDWAYLVSTGSSYFTVGACIGSLIPSHCPLPAPLPVRTFRLTSRLGAEGPVEDARALILLFACFPSVQTAEIHWRSDPPPELLEVVQAWERDTPPRLATEKLTLIGLPELFRPFGPAISPFFARVLAVASRGHLEDLALPVVDEFFVDPAFATLVMPTVTTLRLSTNTHSPYTLLPDLYNITTHTALATFLSASFPFLTHLHLHLRGWFDTTGVVWPAASSPQSLATTFPTILSVLPLLRWSNVVELRLRSSGGHADGDAECCFERRDKDADVVE